MSKLDKITSSNCWLAPRHWVKACPSSKIEDRGNNLLHFNTKNTPYEFCDSAKRFVSDVLERQHAKALKSDTEVLLHAVLKAKELNPEEDGLFLEFGFCTGRSLNFIAALAYEKQVYGFDSGLGLPKFWKAGFEEGVFKYKEEKKMPFCPLDNTTLILDYIENSLPIFKAEIIDGKYDKIDFIHIDTDLYESAVCIYNDLAQFIIPRKTVVVLDQGYNFWDNKFGKKKSDWRDYELKATYEFAESNNYDVQFLAYNKNHQQLALIFTIL